MTDADVHALTVRAERMNTTQLVGEIKRRYEILCDMQSAVHTLLRVLEERPESQHINMGLRSVSSGTMHDLMDAASKYVAVMVLPISTEEDCVRCFTQLQEAVERMYLEA